MNTIILFRKSKKIILLITVLIVFAGCGDKPVKNISTSEAFLKYGKRIEDRSFIGFPECRDKPLKWFDSIPENRLKEAMDSRQMKLNAPPGEYFVFQAGVWAIKSDVTDIQVGFTDLTAGGQKKIEAGKITCFNKGGIDIQGNPFSKVVNVPAGRVQALWIDPSKAEIFIPLIKDFQDSYKKVTLGNLDIPAKKGFLIVIRNKN